MSSAWKIVNNSDINITVIMDSHRELHEIMPRMTAYFSKANPLDRPTFHVFKDPQPDGVPQTGDFICATQVPLGDVNPISWFHIISNNGVLIFDGKTLEYQKK